jgi:uncharacterized protein YaaW (UPF0174 family)
MIATLLTPQIRVVHAASCAWRILARALRYEVPHVIIFAASLRKHVTIAN